MFIYVVRHLSTHKSTPCSSDSCSFTKKKQKKIPKLRQFRQWWNGTRNWNDTLNMKKMHRAAHTNEPFWPMQICSGFVSFHSCAALCAAAKATNSINNNNKHSRNTQNITGIVIHPLNVRLCAQPNWPILNENIFFLLLLLFILCWFHMKIINTI